MITLPTSEETRKALTAKGWYLASEAAGEYEKWRKDGRLGASVEFNAAPYRYSRCEGDVMLVLEACAVLGIVPHGYKLIPADSMAADIAEVLQAYDVDKVTAELDEFFEGTDEEGDAS